MIGREAPSYRTSNSFIVNTPASCPSIAKLNLLKEAVFYSLGDEVDRIIFRAAFDIRHGYRYRYFIGHSITTIPPSVFRVSVGHLAQCLQTSGSCRQWSSSSCSSAWMSATLLMSPAAFLLNGFKVCQNFLCRFNVRPHPPRHFID